MTATLKYLRVPLALFIFAYCFFQVLYPYHLFFREQFDLFLFSSDFVSGFCSKPAIVSSIVDSFLTQFFYLRGAGAIIVSSLLLTEFLLGAAVLRKLKINGDWAAVMVAADMALICATSYPLSMCIGSILMLLASCISLSLSGWLRYLFIALLLPFAYLCAGSAQIIFCAVIWLSVWLRSERYVVAVLTTIVIVAMPLILRESFLLPVDMAYLYPFDKIYSLLPTVLFVVAAIVGHFCRLKWLAWVVAPIVAVVGLARCANFNAEKIMAIDVENYFGNGRTASQLVASYSGNNRIVSYYANIFDAANGSLSEHLFSRYQPAAEALFFVPNQRLSWQSMLMAYDAYKLAGLLNNAQHAAMLGQIFSPKQRSSRAIKYLAEVNWLLGDTLASLKYQRILDKTFFHKKFNEKLRKSPCANVSVWPTDDDVFLSSDVDKALSLLLREQPDNVIAANYLFSYYLLTKNIDAFYNAYLKYGVAQGQYLGRAFAEALLIAMYNRGATISDISNIGIDANVCSDFVKYTKLFESSEGNIDIMKKEYSETYWFYYHFVVQKGASND